MAEIFAVPERGIGKPDYTREIASGRIRPGLTLKEGETLLVVGLTFSTIPSVFPWIKPPLAIGGIAHAINWATGLPLPYSLLTGYGYTIIAISRSTNQDAVLRVYISTPALGIPLSFIGNLGTIEAGQLQLQSDIVPLSSTLFDPLAAYAHQLDGTITNLGGDVLEGSFTVYSIVKAMHTPPLPPDKTVRCKFCGYEWVVPQQTTTIICPNCGQLNWYADFSTIRSLG